METESVQKIQHAPKLQMTVRWRAETLSSSGVSVRAVSPICAVLSPVPIKMNGRAYMLHGLILSLRMG